MAFENEDNVTVSEEAKGLFRSSSVWMRTFAIICFVLLGLASIGFLIFLTNKDGKMMASVMQSELAGPFQEIFGVVMAFIFIAIVLMTYACIKLLSAGNSFTSISYSGKSDSFTKAFKSLKLYWMLYGIMIIISIIFVIYMVAKMLSVMQEMQAQ